MSTENPVVNEGTPAVTPPNPGAPAAEEQASGLPSDQANENMSPWERAKADGYLPDDYKEDPYELAKSWKHGQDFVVEANKEKGRAGVEAKKAESVADQEAAIRAFSPELINNNFELNQEMIDKGKEFGLDEKDLRLKAYELRDSTAKLFDAVGGKDQYNEMISGMSEHMSDDQKKSFNRDLDSGMSEYAVRGLKGAWDAMQSGDTPVKRIEGKQATNTGVKGYSSQAEMMKDLRYLKTGGKNDHAARTQYENRMRQTSDTIAYGR